VKKYKEVYKNPYSFIRQPKIRIQEP